MPTASFATPGAVGGGTAARPDVSVRVSVHPLSHAGMDADGLRSAALFAQRNHSTELPMRELYQRLAGLDLKRAGEIEVDCFRDAGPRHSFSTSVSETGHEVKRGRRTKVEDELIVSSTIAAFTTASEQYQTIGRDHTAVYADCSRHAPDTKQLGPSWPLANVEAFVRQMGSSPFAARLCAIGHAAAATTLCDYAPDHTKQIGEHLRQCVNAGAQAMQGFHLSSHWNVQPQERDRVVADYDLYLHLAMNTVEFSANAVRENSRLGKLYGLLLVQRDLESTPV